MIKRRLVKDLNLFYDEVDLEAVYVSLRRMAYDSEATNGR